MRLDCKNRNSLCWIIRRTASPLPPIPVTLRSRYSACLWVQCPQNTAKQVHKGKGIVKQSAYLQCDNKSNRIKDRRPTGGEGDWVSTDGRSDRRYVEHTYHCYAKQRSAQDVRRIVASDVNLWRAYDREGVDGRHNTRHARGHEQTRY